MSGQREPRVLSVAQVREYDRRAAEVLGIPSAVLMENAGRAAAEEIERALAERGAGRRAAILVGPGNNGGDGYVIARHLANAGFAVELYSSATRASLRGDAALFRAVADRLGLVTTEVVTAHQLARERGRWGVIVGAGRRAARHGLPGRAPAAARGAARGRQRRARARSRWPSTCPRASTPTPAPPRPRPSAPTSP